MKIKASKSRLFFIHVLEIALFFVFFVLIFETDLNYTEINLSNYVIVFFFLIVVVFLLDLLTFNYNVEFDKELELVGGNKSARFESFRKRDSIKNREQQFISKISIDHKRSNNRGFFDHIFGRYRVYNTEGESFIIHKYCFDKENFTIIKEGLNTILNLKIT